MKKNLKWAPQDGEIDPETAIEIGIEETGGEADPEIETDTGTEIVIGTGTETEVVVGREEGNGKRHHRNLMVIK